MAPIKWVRKFKLPETWLRVSCWWPSSPSRTWRPTVLHLFALQLACLCWKMKEWRRLSGKGSEAGQWQHSQECQSTCKCPAKEGPRSTRAAGTAVTLNKLNAGEPKATKEAGGGIAANLAHFSGHPISPWPKDQIHSVSYSVTTTSSE